MMLRKLAISLAIAGALGVSNANALGLGEIKVKSALNEPLSAEIELVQVRTLKPLQIQPRMADVDEFALAGLQRSRFLSNVRFQVQVRPDGTGIVRLTSDEVVREPFLSFLVEINWPNGRLVREYTVLLDPPVFNPAPIRRTVQPVTSAQMDVATIRRGEPVNIPPKPRKAADNIRTRARQGEQIYVGVNDTLWRLAEKNRPDNSITPTQMMVALQRKNPGAFFDNNLNRLKAGVVLDLPTLEEARALTHQQALAEVRRQTRLWKQGKSNKSSAPAPKKQSKPAARQVSSGTEKTVSKLTISAPASEQPVNDTAASGDGSEKDRLISELTQRNQELQTRLDKALENADSASRENAQLSKRLDAIDEHLETLQKLLDVKDSEIAQLQDALADQEDTAAAPVGKGILDYLTSPIALAGIGSGLAALLGGLVFMLVRKRKNKEEPEDKGLVQVPEELKLSAVDETAEAAVEAAAAGDETADDVAEADNQSDMEDLSDLEEVADLDLDMDLELSEPAEAEADDALGDVLAETGDDESRLDDLEFDLGLDEETEAVADQIAAETESLPETADSDSLDAILGETDAFDGTDVDAADLDALLDGTLDAEDVLSDSGAPAADPLDELALPEEDIFADLGMDFDDVDSALDEELTTNDQQDEIDALLAGSEDELADLGEIDAVEDAAVTDVAAQDDIDSLLADMSGSDADDAAESELSFAAEESVSAQDDIDALLGAVGDEEQDALDDLLELDDIGVADLEGEVEAAAEDAEEAAIDGLELADSFDEPELEQAVASEPEVEAVGADSELQLLADSDLDELLATEEVVETAEDPVDELDALLAEAGSDFEFEPASESDAESGIASPELEQADDSLDLAASDSLDVDDLLSQAVGESALEPALDQNDAMSELEALLGAEEQVVAGDEDIIAADPESAVSDLEQELAKLSGLELEESGAESDGASDADLDALLEDEIVEESADFDTLLAEISADEPENESVLGGSDDLALDLELETEVLAPVATDTGMSSQAVTEELTANIAHDLIADEAGLEDVLAESGAAVELEETALQDGLSYEEFDGWSLLESTNENDTKLDLVRAYVDMEDLDGAKEILQEVLNEGSEQQRQDAQKLLQEIG